MIQEFKVSNFYSIRDAQAISFLPTANESYVDIYTHAVSDDVRLLKLGIIYGANASGKSTLLNALEYFRKIVLYKPTVKMDGMDFLPFMLDNHSRKEPSSMRLTFYIDSEKYTLYIRFDKDRIYEETLIFYSSSRPTTLYRRLYDERSDHSHVIFSTKLHMSKKGQRTLEGNTINNCTVLAALGQSNIESTRLNKVYEYFSFHMLNVLSPKMDAVAQIKQLLQNDENGKLKQFLLRLLKASDFNIEDMNVEGEGEMKSLKFRHSGEDGQYELGEAVESAGTKRFLGMALLLNDLLFHNCFIPIDEIETSIHYELLSYFIKVFLANSEGSSQLLMTTHDINLLDEDFIRRDVVWFTDKNQDGATSLKHLSGLGLHKTMSPYNAYTQGKLVKLPFTDSIYLDIQ